MSGPAEARARILLVRLSALGDVVLASAAARALRAQRPDAHLTFAAREPYAALLAGQSWLDERWALPEDARDAAALGPWRERVRAGGFTAVVDLQTNRRSRLLLAGAPHRSAWRAARWQRRRWVSLRFTRPAPVRPEWLRFVDALAPLGVRADLAAPPELDVPAPAAAAARAEDAAWQAALGGGPRPIVFLAPGARWASKRWPVESYLELGRRLVAGGARVLVGGDASDHAALPGLAAWADAEPAARWHGGDLPGLAARIARARAAVANDTGLGHLAAAVGVPVVSVFGSTHPALGFPVAGEGHLAFVRGLSCQPCTLHGRPACPLGHHRCVREIAVPDVLAAVRARLETPAPVAAPPANG